MAKKDVRIDIEEPEAFCCEEHRAQIIRMHHRMQEWRTKHPKTEVLIHYNNRVIFVGPIRQALALGAVHTNEAGFEMLRHMCQNEIEQPYLHRVKKAIELNV